MPTTSTPAAVVAPGRTARWERAGGLYARVALDATFLSAVAPRFGLWRGELGLRHFAEFTRYTIPFLAWAATAAD